MYIYIYTLSVVVYCISLSTNIHYLLMWIIHLLLLTQSESHMYIYIYTLPVDLNHISTSKYIHYPFCGSHIYFIYINFLLMWITYLLLISYSICWCGSYIYFIYIHFLLLWITYLLLITHTIRWSESHIYF